MGYLCKKMGIRQKRILLNSYPAAGTRAKKWQPDLDSNQDKVNQNHLCYRYTIRLRIFDTPVNIPRFPLLSREEKNFFQKKRYPVEKKDICSILQTDE